MGQYRVGLCRPSRGTVFHSVEYARVDEASVDWGCRDRGNSTKKRGNLFTRQGRSQSRAVVAGVGGDPARRERARRELEPE